MRVCMFAMLLPAHVTGGMEIHSLDLAKGMAARGHDVTIITTRHPKGLKKEELDGVKVFYADENATSKRPIGRRSLTILEELNAKKRFDVIHSQSFSAYHYVKSGLKRKLGIPLVTTLHGTSYGEIRSNLKMGPSLMLAPKIAFHIYNHLFHSWEFVRASDAVIAISDELAADIPGEYGISPAKVRTIHNGINTELFRPDASPLKAEYSDKRIILSVSVLHRQKGVQYLIDAFEKVRKRLPDTHLMVVGDGPYRSSLESQAVKAGLYEHVTFMGRIANSKLREYYNLADVFVIPTIRVEGLPLIELESMACGKPVIASDIGGIPTVIRDGKNGILVKPKDVRGLASKIVDVLEDKGLAERLSSAARKTIEESFSRDKMVQDTLRVYEGCRAR